MKLMCATVNWHLHFYQSMSAILLSSSIQLFLPQLCLKKQKYFSYVPEMCVFDNSQLCLSKTSVNADRNIFASHLSHSSKQ